MKLEITKKQQMFIVSEAFEVLYGGAAGGGKSYGQLVDAFLYSLKYPKSKQLVLRRTFPELEKSLIRVSLELYPREVAKYNTSSHVWTFKNGSIIDFAYCDTENDVFKYQSAEYDVIRFDELTHFTETMYTYLISRVRGANNYPKHVKSSTNPGGVGHSWVKGRFIDIGAPMETYVFNGGSRQFIPSLVTENKFLMESDPDYLKRLENLSENEKQKLRYGNWDVYEGQYFTEFKRDVHVCTPFDIPSHWKKTFTMDYGLDMLAGYWIAIDEQNHAYVYKELYESDLIITKAAQRIKKVNGKDDIYAYLAPPDLFNRRQETGKSVADTFILKGIKLSKTSNKRVAGWLAVKEWLQIVSDEFGNESSNLKIFSSCTNLIRTLPQLQRDTKNPNDVANEPHELTHAPDALRGFCVSWSSPTKKKEKEKIYNFDSERPKPKAGGKGTKSRAI